MFKRILAAIICAATIFTVLCSCKTVEIEESSELTDVSSGITIETRTDGNYYNDAAEYGHKYDNLDFGAEGDKLYNMVLGDFWDGTLLKAYEYLNNKDQTAFNWPYGSFLQMQSAYIKLHPDDETAVNTYKTALKTLDTRYMTFRTDDLVAYSSSYDKNGDVYYDDNGWIALEFATAYDMFGDDEYLEKVKNITEFLYTGWDDTIGGGIWWKVGLKEDKNGFTNSPVSMLSSWLYNKTGEQRYLDWAEKIYDWVKKYLRQDNGLIADSINQDYSINRLFYTYTTGTTISAAVELYRITGDKTYLDDATQSAKAAINGLGVFEEDFGAYVFNVDFPNWHGWLLDAYLRLYEFAPEDAINGAETFQYALGFASGRARYDNGYFIVDWKSTKSTKQIDLLHQAGTARCFLNIQNFLNMTAE